MALPSPEPLPSRTVRDIIVIGASAGGVEALREFVARLPATFPGSIFISVHFPEHATSSLPRILARSGSLPAFHPLDGDAIVPGRIFVAPPDHHLMFSRTAVHLVRGSRENGNRPAADPMFRSAALTFGPRVIGVALTGNLDDGTSGLAAIKRAGGLAVAQDPDEALFSSMPRSAIDHVPIDRVVSITDLANTLIELMAVPLPQRETAGAMSDDDKENELSAVDLHQVEAYEQNPGRISGYSCPDCGGVLRELHDGQFIRFRCRMGHAWTGDALLLKQRVVMDDALWTALRSLEENIALARQLAKRHTDRGQPALALRFERQARNTETRAAVIRDVLVCETTSEPVADSPAQANED